MEKYPWLEAGPLSPKNHGKTMQWPKKEYFVLSWLIKNWTESFTFLSTDSYSVCSVWVKLWTSMFFMPENSILIKKGVYTTKL